MDLTTYSDPLDFVDWRWRRVMALRKEGKTPTDADDKYIWRGYQFGKDMDDCDGSDTAMFSVTMKHRDVARACSLSTNKGARKYYLEALSLCKDADEQRIATYMGETLIMVRNYQKLFFDVRDKLESTGYICSRIMEPALIQNIQDCKDPNIAWKVAALFGGFDAVRVCWENQDTTSKTMNYFKRSGFASMMKNFSMGQFLMPVNKFNAHIIADQVIRLAEIEANNLAARGAQGIETERVDMLKQIMGAMKFFVTDPSQKAPAREPRLFEKIDPALVAAATGEKS